MEKRRPRIYYTETQKALMWERWKKGDSLAKIAQLFDRHHSAVQGILVRTGGIRPAVRRRSRLALTLAEREEISRAVVAGQTMRAIAKRLGRATSTISRELHRNGGQECYRASEAEQAAWDRASRPKVCKLADHRELAHLVADKLKIQWSPIRNIGVSGTLYDWQHYIPLIQRKPGALRNGAPFADMPVPLQHLRALLLRHEGGDRVMAKVLAEVPKAGLENVLVAVELVLESGAPSAEHVENMLNRLKAPPMPEAIDSPLQISEEPIADTARYDRLRDEVTDHA